MASVDSSVCLVCDASVGVSTRKCCPIFEQRVTTSDRLIVAVLSSMLGINLSADEVHSNVICKKCFKTCNELDELEDRQTELRMELTNNYHKTLKKLARISDQNETIIVPDELKQDGIKLLRSRSKQIGDEDKSALLQLLQGSGNTDDEGEGDDPDDSIDEVEETIKEVEVDKEEEDVMCLLMDNDKKEHMEVEEDIKPEKGDEDFVLEQRKRRNTKRPKITRKRKDEKCERRPVLVPAMVVKRDRENYTCLICNDLPYSSDARGMGVHLREKHEIRMFFCDVCGAEFFKRTELTRHIDEHLANENDSYECEICRRVFTNFRLFRVHKKMHGAQQKNYTCETCGKRFGSRNLLEEHMNVHTGERPYCCSACGKSFTSKYTLRSHEKTHEDRPRPFNCINCGKGFFTQQNLIHHERIHSGIKNYVCEECGRSFNTSRNLETHFVLHTGFKPYICRLCGKSFTRKPEIRDHERTHTGEKPYQCEYCGASFCQRSNLQSHKRTTHYDDKRYKCTDCGRAFKRRRLLDYHMKAAHTGERPYKCTICLATFIYPEHFKKHKLIHTGEKPYECEVCGKAFNSRDNRNAHRFVHSDKKPYECLVCGLGFMRKPLLYNHMNTAGHQNDTIVVNQPRLSNDDLPPQLAAAVNVSSADSQIEMTLITEEDGTRKLVPTTTLAREVVTDQKPYLNDISEHILLREEHQQSQNLHIVMDGNVEVQYTSTHDIDSVHHHVPSAETILPENIQEIETATSDYQESAVKTDNGIQIVQIRFPGNDENDDQKQWINLLQAHH